ncbi:hypothetical protein D3C75_843630 [compost metagenome]
MDKRNVNGSVHISNQAIAKIASSAIQATNEVTALVQGRTKRTDKKKFYKAIGIEIKELELIIDINPIVRLETPLHQLSRTLQFKVKQEVEKMTGLIVSAVNIGVVGIRSEE